MTISDYLSTYIRLPDSRATSVIKEEIRDELEFHQAMLEESNLRSGLPPDEAKRAAREEFGVFEQVEKKCQSVQLGERRALQRIQAVGVLVFVAGLISMAWWSSNLNRNQNAAVAKLTQTIQDLQSQIVSISDAAAPTLVGVFPKVGATEVDPSLTEIRATFSKPMLDKSWSWCETDKSFPEITGQIHYTEDLKTCILPVRLEPNTEYVLTLNSTSNQNFKDQNGQALTPVELVFKTAGSPLIRANSH